MSLCLYHESLSIREVQKFKLQKYQNNKKIIFLNTEIQITGVQKNKLHKYQIANYTHTEMQITGIQKNKLNICQNTNRRKR